ncbi:hypothetical protein QTP88_003024 [Uroleucon formosanum]
MTLYILFNRVDIIITEKYIKNIFQGSHQTEDEDLILLTPTKTYNKYKTSNEVELIFACPNSIISTPQKEKISDLIDMPSPSFKKKHSHNKDPDTPRKIKLKQQIEKKSKKIKNKNSQICKLKNYASKFKIRNNLNNLINAHQFPSCNSRALVTMQLKNKRRTWTTAERNLAFTFFYKSPTAYNFLRLQKINLPAPSTIRRWIGESKFLPGFNGYFFDHVQKKFEHQNYKDKACSIGFDEMYIKEFLEYSKQYDFIEGFQDLGTYGRMNKSANCVLVFLASVQQHPSPSHDKIYSLFDVPHLLKSVRNNFIEACFQKNDQIFSYKDIKDTYDLDKLSKKSNALSKITDAHIHPTSFQKMRVKLAVQLLSHSMSSAIRTCTETGQLCSKTAIDTADFIEFMNNLFDCLNSRSLYSNNPYNAALTHTGIVKTFLINASKYFVNLKKIKKGKISQPPCFKGFTQTINAILQFFEEEKCNDIFFLMTNRLNQDKLENLFSIFRQKGGYNKNPTARTIRTSIRSSCIFSLCASTATNCEPSQDTNDFISIDADKISNTETIETYYSDDESSISLSSSDNKLKRIDEIQTNRITLEDCSVTYFAGYLIYKCYKKFNCQNCQNNLQTNKNLNDKNQLLLINKNYSSCQNDIALKAPSINFNKIINRVLEIFEKHFDKIQYKKKIRFKLTLKMKNHILINKWINEFESCVEHKLYIIDLLLICKIFKKTHSYSTTSQLAKISKLKILNNI